MTFINDHYLKLADNYLFSEIAKRIESFQRINPTAEIIRLGIGDVTQPLPKSVIEAMHQAVEEMSSSHTFHGYGPERGYRFLIDAIIKHDYGDRGVTIEADEVFINDGAKSDLGNITELFAKESRVAITDPVYPVYVDSNVMAGRGGQLQENGQWGHIIYIECSADNLFIPKLPPERPDIIYLCYPNNPTGTTLTREQLTEWVNYALAHKSIILFDSAYEAFIQDKNIPRTIYEIEGAKRCAIEFRSYSKTAGFTGMRCGYTVVPKDLMGSTKEGKETPINPLWNRRQSTKFNGASYIIQRGAAAIYSDDGQKQVQDTIDYYLDNSRIIREGLSSIGLSVFGGDNAPYVWAQVPSGLTSWQFFERLLNECHIVGTPGVGFGRSGEGYFRFSAFGEKKKTLKAVERIRNWNI